MISPIPKQNAQAAKSTIASGGKKGVPVPLAAKSQNALFDQVNQTSNGYVRGLPFTGCLSGWRGCIWSD